MRLEVYLQSAVLRGILATNQERLSNYLILREGDEVFSLREATLEGLSRKPVATVLTSILSICRKCFSLRI